MGYVGLFDTLPNFEQIRASERVLRAGTPAATVLHCGIVRAGTPTAIAHCALALSALIE